MFALRGEALRALVLEGVIVRQGECGRERNEREIGGSVSGEARSGVTARG